MRKTQVYCSYSCARYGQAMGRDDAWLSKNARHAGLVAGSLARAAARKRYEALAADLTPAEAWRQGYEKGYAAGYSRAAYGRRDRSPV